MTHMSTTIRLEKSETQPPIRGILSAQEGRRPTARKRALERRVLRVHILYEHGGDFRPHACPYIRLLQPLSHPSNAGAIRLSWGVHYEPSDVVIVERFWKPVAPWTPESVVKKARADGCCLIYALDDNLLDLTRDRLPWGLWTPGPDDLHWIRYFATEADGIIAATSRLRERLLELNERVYVVPNALDERLFRDRSLTRPRQTNGRRIIGYMGSPTHEVDLMMIQPALRNVLRAHFADVEFQMVGGCLRPDFLRSLDGLPVRVLGFAGDERYPKFVRWMRQHIDWDLALAPIKKTSFTRCKSDMKFLDYSILGVPGIYSRVTAYETVSHLETGYLVENDPNKWEAAIEQLLADEPLRLFLARNAEQHVRSTRMLEQNAHLWREAIDAISAAVNPRSSDADPVRRPANS
jgi:glycosyltransferase involved in cell wall biosynthesis